MCGVQATCAAERAEKAEAAAGAVTVHLLGDSEGGVAVAGWRWHSDREKGVLVGPVGRALGMGMQGEERWLVTVHGRWASQCHSSGASRVEAGASRASPFPLGQEGVLGGPVGSGSGMRRREAEGSAGSY
ncbi:hypothetical protein BDZ97DRAFT_1762012 [Flammula alnicola]|nr:hypothetical protein BDZ97DRAFT_1762012 [Flammula alnicola]